MFARVLVASWLGLVLVGFVGCGGDVGCPVGRTPLDGVCVREAVAEYVACIRATSPKLGPSAAGKLSAEASDASVRAQFAADVSSELERIYADTGMDMDKDALEIIESCRGIRKPRGARGGADDEATEADAGQ